MGRSDLVAMAASRNEVARIVVPAIVVEMINDNFRTTTDQPSKRPRAPMASMFAFTEFREENFTMNVDAAILIRERMARD